MDNLTQFKQQFENCFFELNEELIFRLDKDDLTGQLNNVIIGLNRECYGVRLFEEKDESKLIEIYYVHNKIKLEGNLIRIELDNPNYSFLLLSFCSILALNFPEINEINAFNTFQKQLRTILEKDGYFTLTNLDIEKLKEFGSNGNFINIHYKAIKQIDLIPIVDFYREIFDNNYEIVNRNLSEYVYLMINTETALIKIGFSKKPKFREKTLQSQEPQIYLIACWNVKREIETALHRKYKIKRKRGEYFKLDFNDLRELKDSLERYNL